MEKFLFEGIMVGDRFVTFKKNLENSKIFEVICIYEIW